IVVAGRLAGVVVVPPQAPFGFLLGRWAPMLALVAAGVLIVGGALTSVMIFGPARRRLRALESAARRFGAGDLSARAPGRGGDAKARLERLIGELLDLARLEGGGGTLRIEPVSVAQLFARVSARHERACHEAGVAIGTVIEPGAKTVMGDRDRLEQALQNLAAN